MSLRSDGNGGLIISGDVSAGTHFDLKTSNSDGVIEISGAVAAEKDARFETAGAATDIRFGASVAVSAGGDVALVTTGDGAKIATIVENLEDEDSRRRLQSSRTSFTSSVVKAAGSIIARTSGVASTIRLGTLSAGGDVVVEGWQRMASCEHLHNGTTNTPDVSFATVTLNNHSFVNTNHCVKVSNVRM